MEKYKRCTFCSKPTSIPLADESTEEAVCDHCADQADELDKLFEQRRDELWRETYEPCTELYA